SSLGGRPRSLRHYWQVRLPIALWSLRRWLSDRTELPVWPFRKKVPQSPRAVFSDPEALFRLQCKYGQVEIQPGTAIVAIVLDARKEFGTPFPIKTETGGRQTALVRVAATDGGFSVLASTPGAGEPLNVGDLVMWVPVKWMKDVAIVSADPRLGWVGLIRAKVKPEASLDNSSSWKLLCRYD